MMYPFWEGKEDSTLGPVQTLRAMKDNKDPH